jgi:hypothetical protein
LSLRSVLRTIALGLCLALFAATNARAQHAIDLDVAETAGIRRTEFPVEDFVLQIPSGRLPDLEHIRLRLGANDAPCQFTAIERWPDQSVRRVSLDFNVSIGPGETRQYRVEYGPDTPAGPAAGRGLTVTEDSDSIQVGTLRFSKTGFPLIRSANYRGEFIGTGVNGLVIVDSAGNRHDFSQATGVAVEVNRRGPLNVALHYSGRVPLDGPRHVQADVVLTMPNSKSWVRATAVVTGGAGLVRELAFDLPLGFGPHPWTWDLGTDSGTYGAFRTATDTVSFTQKIGSREQTGWTTRTRTGSSDERLYESSAGRRDAIASGWAHLVDGTKAVAFAIPRFDANGLHTIRFGGDGHTSVSFAADGQPPAHTLSVVYHFVAAPVAIGAATSPAAILSPLVVTPR